jgi:hypothetical protein
MILDTPIVRQWVRAADRVHAPVSSRRRRGHPYAYSTTVIIRCYLLMLIAPRLRQHAALHRYLCDHRVICRLVGLEQVPHRTTFGRRFKALEHDLRARIQAMGQQFILAGVVSVHVLLADGTLHQAAGPVWPAKFQKQGIVHGKWRNVDRLAGWGKSPYQGWVWGYRTHPVVALTAELEPIPILADARPANVQDNTLLAEQLPDLPADATVLVLDSSYEDEALALSWERQDPHGVWTRWMVIETKRRKGQPAAWRQRMQVRRELEERDLYTLRGTRIEPFFAHWKQAFDLARLPLQGRDAPIYLLLALYGYQLLIWNNWQAGRPTYAYQALILGCG